VPPKSVAATLFRRARISTVGARALRLARDLAVAECRNIDRKPVADLKPGYQIPAQ
jgi:hypothetical protein